MKESKMRSNSQQVTPHSSRSSSREHTPVAHDADRKATEDYLSVLQHLGKHVFVVVLSMIFGIFAGLSSSSFFSFAFRLFFLALTVYIINFIFYKRGARSITETFLTAFSVVSYTYFVVSCPFSYFIPTLLICAIVAIIYYKLA